MLIGLMSLPNQVVFTQFHPVAYMVKLNIEMTMASLITKIARATGVGDDGNRPHNSSGTRSRHDGLRTLNEETDHDIAMKSFHTNAVGAGRFDDDDDDDYNTIKSGPGKGGPKGGGIQRRVDIRVETASTSEDGNGDVEKGSSPFDHGEDEMSLANHPGHPRGANAQ